MPKLKLRFLQVTIVLLALPVFGGSPSERIAYIPLADAKPVLETLGDAVPAELREAASEKLERLWPEWVRHRDAEIRERLTRGDEDSVVNFLLFGTSFTHQPRITLSDLRRFAAQEPAGSDMELKSLHTRQEMRIADLVKGMDHPGKSERLLFARHVAERVGNNFQDAESRDKVKDYLRESLARVLRERSGYARVLEEARLLGDATAEFAERSKLYRDRGLSLDTSILPNVGVEESLKEMLKRGQLTRRGVHRVGIIGPGLDFVDKQDGYDFYPQQTIQPFALIDSILRLGLAQSGDLDVMTFDLSPRVNEHLASAQKSARDGVPYTVQLPLDSRKQWKKNVLGYWARFGDQVGVPAKPLVVPAQAGLLKIRAVRIRPEMVSHVTPVDLNVVMQRLELAAGEPGFDLVIATNIFVYYNVFEQSLALANVERMLRPGGFMLSNNALPELPNTRIHSVDYTTVVYSNAADDGDHIVWYQREP